MKESLSLPVRLVEAGGKRSSKKLCCFPVEFFTGNVFDEKSQESWKKEMSRKA
jgi:hypothetical protein